MAQAAAETEQVETVDVHLANLDKLRDTLPGADVPWLAELRRKAEQAYRSLGWPTTRDEAWKYTSLRELKATAFGAVDREAALAAPVTADALTPYRFDGLDSYELVLVDGHVRPELSRLAEVPNGVTVGSLAAALADDHGADRLQGVLGDQVSLDEDAFAALNTASFADGAFIHVPRDTVLDKPVHVLHLSTGRDAPFVTHPRTVAVAERSAQLMLIESYGGPDGVAHLTVPVTEVVARDNAHVFHYKLALEGDQAAHLATQRFRQARDAVVRAHNITLGGALVRNDIVDDIDGEGADSLMNGLYVIGKGQRADTHARIQHMKPHCTSYQLYKGVLDADSRGVFNGRIYVAEGAQKTDAYQHNPNLLLSDQALANSSPQLEIFADDVRCSHGSTTGQMDASGVFYLQSRGLDAETARSLLTYAFAGEVIEQIKLAPVRTKVRDLVLARLPKGDLVREAFAAETPLGEAGPTGKTETAAGTAEAAGAAEATDTTTNTETTETME